MYTKKIKILCLLILIAILGGCATTKPDVSVYLREDVDTSKSRIIVFPVLITDGKRIKMAEVSNPIADALFGKSWADALGAENTIVIPKIALDQIPGVNDALNTIISVLDTTSAVEQTTQLTKFLEAISAKFGDGAFAFALVFENEEEYNSSKKVHLNMGLFDIKKLTWKWITKHSFSAGLVPMPYQSVVNQLISESYEALKEKSNGVVR